MARKQSTEIPEKRRKKANYEAILASREEALDAWHTWHGSGKR
jgi:hypothetical protein